MNYNENIRNLGDLVAVKNFAAQLGMCVDSCAAKHPGAFVLTDGRFAVWFADCLTENYLEVCLLDIHASLLLTDSSIIYCGVELKLFTRDTLAALSPVEAQSSPFSGDTVGKMYALAVALHVLSLFLPHVLSFGGIDSLLRSACPGRDMSNLAEPIYPSMRSFVSDARSKVR